MYQVCLSIPTRDPIFLRYIVERLVDSLVQSNVFYLQNINPNVPELYESGVFYEPDVETGPEIQWWLIPDVLRHGFADCKALAAYRTAELLVRGIEAYPIVTQQRRGNLILNHVRVYTPWGIEDPSKILGM